ncbi:MAG: GNAT family N-acetyltransferase [Firmicutes bacterium]|nr:GNAT family N-acetyltransferase [Bacillota bacterium]
MNIIIDKLNTQDIPAVTGLLEKSFRIGKVNAQKSIAMIKEMLKDKQDIFLAAKLGSEIVGFIHIHLHRDPFRPEMKHATFWYFAVSPNYRNKGIGMKLFEAAVTMCKGMGINEIRATTSVSHTIAQRVAENCGFKRGVSYKLKLTEN